MLDVCQTELTQINANDCPTMDKVTVVSQPMIGRHVWGIRRGHGSVFWLEFGEPRLHVREPIVPSPNTDKKLSRMALPRGAVIRGEWTVWVCHAHWQLQTHGGLLDSGDKAGSTLDLCLRDLEGQKLVAASTGDSINSAILQFDLGANLKIWPAVDFDSQWTVFVRDGMTTSFNYDGTVVTEEAKQERES